MLAHKKLFLLDMDGTIYLDGVLFPKTSEFLNHVKSIGGRYLFLTNNSSKSVDDYVEKLNSVGVLASYQDFLTSSQATARHLIENHVQKKIYVLGTRSLKKELEGQGLNVVDRFSNDIECLLVGFDTELTFRKLEDACKILKSDVHYIATNPDWVCPTSYGFVPDCGSICRMLQEATDKKPLFIGKPEPFMAYLAMEKAGFSREETIIIGDRIYTDIACGINAGITTALVLSGETKREDIQKSEHTPDLVYPDIGKILQALKTKRPN